jgi:hypothetical protein
VAQDDEGGYNRGYNCTKYYIGRVVAGMHSSPSMFVWFRSRVVKGSQAEGGGGMGM